MTDDQNNQTTPPPPPPQGDEPQDAPPPPPPGGGGFQSAPPPPPPGGGGPQGAPVEGFKTWEYIKEAFGLLIKYPVPFLLGNLAMLVINGFAFGLLAGPWYAGMMRMTAKARRGQAPEFGDIFSGFDNFGNVFGAGVVFSVGIAVGAILCVIPAFIAGAYLMWVIPFVAIKGMPLGDALKASYQEAAKGLMGHILFFFIVSVITVSGALLCYVPIIFTAPLGILTMAVAYDDRLGQ